MQIALWGTRGSLPSFGPENQVYGGNTTCVQVTAEDGTLLVLDAGTGIRRLGHSLRQRIGRVDLLLTHLHMDHLQGLGFFGPLFEPDLEVHLWGPAHHDKSLEARLVRYLSPPLFPVRLRELPSKLECHDVPRGTFSIGELTVTADYVCHPGATVGYRIEENGRTFTFMPDHEPALGDERFPSEPRWTSGYTIANGADMLIHDCQYTRDEYRVRVGWGHSAMEDAMAFAAMCGVGKLVTFHHDPSHDDAFIERMLADAVAELNPTFEAVAGREGDIFRV
jgi:phosphoribosyl 1,2-cyclic phosphodiesterase